MHQPKTKYSISIKPSQQSCTIKSVLTPDLSLFDNTKISLHWYRQPPPPYEIQELTRNHNSPNYKCSSLDFECLIVCKVFADDGKQVSRFDYGPVESFVYSRLSTTLELRVHVLLFGTWKKCVFALGIAPTLINPQNNNKYPLTQQDIRSIFVKPQSMSFLNENVRTQSQPEGLSILNGELKKTIVIENLFQRLILLKLFHEIPNKKYCESTEVLQIAFYDQSSCNMALLAINRFKYQKRDTSEVSKSMYGLPTQQLTVTKMMKKSNDSFTQLKGQFPPNGPIKNLSQDTLKKQFLPLAAFTNWRKSPKQSINSANQSSIISGNSSKANDSRASLIQKNLQIARNLGQNQSQGLGSKGSSEYRSRVSIKQPKISILSTDINSTKQRQQKPSFPQNPPATQTLKSSQLIIKPKEFKSSLSLRRSQEEIKTPRMDEDEQIRGLNSAKLQGPVKKKSASQIQIPNPKEEVQEKDQYVNEFQNLLFEVGQDENKEAQFCLNDSFAKLQEEEEKQKLQIIHSPSQKPQKNNKSSGQQHILQFISPPSPTKSQRNVISLKQTLKTVLQQNYDLRQKNQELKKQITQAKTNGDKKYEIEKFEGQIRKMQEIKNQLQVQIQGLKKSVIMSNSQVVDRSKMQNSWINRTGQKDKLNHSFTRQQERPNQSPSKDQSGQKQQYFPGKKPQPYKFTGSLFFPPRQSKAGPQISIKPTQPSSPTFIARRSQQYDPSNFAIREAEQVHQQQSPKNIVLTSGDLKFMKFQQDPDYQKFRNNQSYSYKQTETMKMDERRLPREYHPYKF